MIRLPVLVLAAALVLAVAPARADYEAGRAALDAGDPAAALAEWLAPPSGCDSLADLRPPPDDPFLILP